MSISFSHILVLSSLSLIAGVLSSLSVSAAVVQCPDHKDDGCIPPHWDVRWDMAGSGYIYCYETCPIEWLYNHSSIYGVYGGVLGVDHYWTHQGMPCIKGIPQEFAMQDTYAKEQKQRFPRIKILEYRITDAVPYADIVHQKMIDDPQAFVRWENGSICEMPYVEHQTEGFGCAWEIRAAAYDYSQQRVRDWYLENIIKPTLTVADGTWLDGDGPDNGAWMCSGSYDYAHLIPPYPALNDTQIAAFCAGEDAVVLASIEWLIANGGYDYNCFTFLHGRDIVPEAGDSADVCASKMTKLDHRPAKSAIVLYGDRIGGSDYTDINVKEAVAIFMLTRAESWFFGFPAADTLNATTAAWLLSDFGAAVGNMTRVTPTSYVFQRQYEKAMVQLNCINYTASFISSAGHEITAAEQ